MEIKDVESASEGMLLFELHEFGLQNAFVECDEDLNTIKHILEEFANYFLGTKDAALRRLGLRMYTVFYQYLRTQLYVLEPSEPMLAAFFRRMTNTKDPKWIIHNDYVAVLMILIQNLPEPTSAKATLVSILKSCEKLGTITRGNADTLIKPEQCAKVLDTIDSQIRLKEMLEKRGIRFEMIITKYQIDSDRGIKTDGIAQVIVDKRKKEFTRCIIWMMPIVDDAENYISTLYHEIAHMLLRMYPVSRWYSERKCAYACGFDANPLCLNDEDLEEILATIVGNGLLLDSEFAKHFTLDKYDVRSDDKDLWTKIAKCHIIEMQKSILGRTYIV